jgi:hypothetical protein
MTQPQPPEQTPEVALRESALETLRDLTILVGTGLPSDDPERDAATAAALSEELAELAAMLRALPGRPRQMSGGAS